MLEEEILRLIYDYSVKPKLFGEKRADCKLISKLVETVVSYKSLDNFVSDLRFDYSIDNGNGGILASYSFNSKEIEIYYGLLKLHKIIDSKRAIIDFSDFESNMYEGLRITQIILHELEHAGQNSQRLAPSDCNEYMILSASLFSDSCKHRQVYCDNRRLVPYERMAEINSFVTILSAIDSIKTKIPNLYAVEQALFNRRKLDGYFEANMLGGCPLEVYLKLIEKEDIWSRIKNDSIESLDERLKLGFPITNSEYDNVHLLTLKYKLNKGGGK